MRKEKIICKTAADEIGKIIRENPDSKFILKVDTEGSEFDIFHSLREVGLLHDIGRRNGNMQARHAIEGFQFLTSIGFDEGARICLTHTFQYKDIEAIYDTWDCSDDEKHFMAEYLQNVTYMIMIS